MKTAGLAFLIVTVAVVFALGGYFLGMNAKPKPTSPKPSPAAQAARNQIGPSSIIKNQQALAVGEITDKSNDGITLKGDDNQEATFKLSPSLTIYPPAASSGKASQATTDKAAIALNKKALVTLELQGEEYLVKAISYFSGK